LRHTCARLAPFAFNALVSNLDGPSIDEVFHPSDNILGIVVLDHHIYGEGSIGDIEGSREVDCYCYGGVFFDEALLRSLRDGCNLVDGASVFPEARHDIVLADCCPVEGALLKVLPLKGY
jgi:hypothetical protein